MRGDSDSIWSRVCIAIPSYKRPETIQKKTLSVLHSYKIPAEKIYIFVANAEEEKEYKEKVPKEMYNKLIVGQKGLGAIRNFIFQYFPVGTPIVECDDDIQSFLEYSSRAKRHEKELGDLKDVIMRGFTECLAAKCRLWGVYPIPNGFFMKPGVSTDLKFCIGSFWGCFNPGKEIKIDSRMGEKEDYERTLKFFVKEGAVVRLNYVAPKTAYYKEAGGLQDFSDRRERQEEAVKGLLEKWPNWIRRNPVRKSGYPEIRLKDPRTKEEKEKRTGLDPKYGSGGRKTRRKGINERI
jgi:hypothetical protein